MARPAAYCRDRAARLHAVGAGPLPAPTGRVRRHARQGSQRPTPRRPGRRRHHHQGRPPLSQRDAEGRLAGRVVQVGLGLIPGGPG